jgi:DNA-binding CsgD family transcriptional regulator/tetratricopeptide (TPR) repeat protein
VSTSVRLVGRDSELAVLVSLVRTVRRGGRLAAVEGEAGIGKTRLVQAALDEARANGAEVLAARAEELDAYRPFAPIVDCVPEPWRGRVDVHLRAWETGPDAAAERQFRVAETVLELLDELCLHAPVVLAIEDLHWADPATLGVLARVATSIDKLPVALVVSARPQPRRPELERLLGLLAARDAAIVGVGPLDERACIELVQELVGARPGERLVAQARRAAGNPLFVGELVAALQAGGAVVRHDGTADVAVAEAVPSLPVTILHRLSFLAPEQLEQLGLASVLGVSFAAGDLAILAGLPVSELVPGLRSAQRAGVLAEQGERIAFRHELVRDALYQDMPLTVRRGLHNQFAAALGEAGEPTERVAEHVLRGAAPGDERAVEALARVARDLVGRNPAGAADLYRQAIALSSDPGARRLQLLPDLADALVSAGALDEGERACRDALRRDLDAERAARLRLQLVMLLMRRGRPAEAAREGGAATGDRLRAWVAMSRVFEGEIEPAVRDAHAVLEASDDEVDRALATNTLAIAADASGRFAQAAELMEPSVRWADRAASREAHDARPHMILGLMLARLDRLDEASATIERGRRAAEALGFADALPVYHYQAAWVAHARGNLDDALAELSAHAQLAEQTAIGWHLSAESLRALIALHHDDLVAAERHVSAAEREAAAGAPPFGIDLMVLARALVCEATGDARPALDALAGTFAAAPTFQPVIGPELARLAVATGERARAAGVPEALRRIAELNPGARSLDAGALRARGLLDDDADALLAAVDRLRASGRRLECARAAEDAAAALDGDRARGLLAEAREAYERSGAARGIARVEAAQRALGVRRGVGGPRRRPSTGWEALTDTELKVVRLVAERLTNPEIAERMFISRRTVQTHVSHALTKLGVGTRRELAAEAARRAGWRFRVEGVADQAQQPEPAVEAAGTRAVDDDRA